MESAPSEPTLTRGPFWVSRGEMGRGSNGRCGKSQQRPTWSSPWRMSRSRWRSPGRCYARASSAPTVWAPPPRAIFFTCAVGHAAHAIHLIGPSLGLEEAAGIPMRASATWPHVFWEVFTAGDRRLLLVAAAHLWPVDEGRQALRGHPGAPAPGPRDQRQHRAGPLRGPDGPGLNEREISEEALRSTLESAREIISDLLGEANSEVALGPGELIRKQAAEVPAKAALRP